MPYGGTVIPNPSDTPCPPPALPYETMVEALPAPMQPFAFVLRCCTMFIFNFFVIPVIVGMFILTSWQLNFPLLDSSLSFGAVVSAWITMRIMATPDAGTGSRGPSVEGMPELSLETLRSLTMAKGSAPPLCESSDFKFLEVSVQETADHNLVVLHPTSEKGFRKAFPRKGRNTDAIQEIESKVHKNFDRFSASQVTLEQLKTLDLFGKDGVQICTLEEFLTAARKRGLKKPIAVEVRHIFSDRARAGLLRHLGSHLREMENSMGGADNTLQSGIHKGAYQGFGSSIALVSTPSRFAASFGEFGTPVWAHWVTRFRQAEVPTVLKCCHSINLGFLAPEHDT